MQHHFRHRVGGSIDTNQFFIQNPNGSRGIKVFRNEGFALGGCRKKEEERGDPSDGVQFSGNHGPNPNMVDCFGKELSC
jgi:hypothetical protein